MNLFNSMQRSLLFVVTAAILPALLLVVLMGLRQREYEIAQAKADAEQSIEHFALFSERFTFFAHDTLSSIDRMIAKTDHSKSIMRGILRDYLHSSSGYLNIMVTNETGEVVASALPSIPGTTAKDRLYFERARQQLRFAAGEIIKSRTADTFTLHFALPILNERKDFQGVTMVAVDPDVFQQALNNLPRPQDSTVALADHQGIILRSSPMLTSGMGQRRLPGEILPYLQTQESRGSFQADLLGEPTLFTFLLLRLSPDQQPYAYVVMRTPLASLYAKAQSQMINNLALLAAAAVLAAVMTQILGRAVLTSRVEHILSTARRFGQGDLDARTGVTQSKGELSALAQSFDDMAARLKERILRQDEIQAALYESEQRFRAVFEHSSQFIGLLSPDGLVLEVNDMALNQISATFDDVAGRPFWECPWWSHDPELSRQMHQAVLKAANGEVVRFETTQNGRRGPAHVDFTLTPVFNATNEVMLLIPEGHDISERFRMEAELRYVALHDALTGLPNRSLVRDRLESCLTKARADTQHLFAVLFLDLDRFKVVNDSLGHEVGDIMLAQVSDRLMRNVREGETVARFGGDEFVLLLENLRSRREAIQVAKRLLDVLGEPYMAAGHRLVIKASVGVEFTPSSLLTADLIIRNANLAMHYAKQAGGDRLKVFHPKLLERLHTAMTVEQELDFAIAKGQIELVYQPIVDAAKDGRISGFEALCRWRHPDRGYISPDSFIPIAEATGKIVALGAYVLDLALSTLADWREKGLAQELFMSVNLSARQITRADIVVQVQNGLTLYNIPPWALHLEVTETALTESTAGVRDRLRELSNLGVNLAVDDFGTGYSNMAQLTKLPLNDLKIDLSMVSGIASRPEAVAVTKAILAMSESLGLRVIAEGVETASERDFLLGLGCRFQQGYFHAKPLSRKLAEQLLAETTADLP